MRTALLLVGCAALPAVPAPVVLVRAGGTERAPRLGSPSWQYATGGWSAGRGPTLV